MSLPNNPIHRIEQWKGRLATIFVLILFVVHPLIISPQTYYNITSTKLYFYISTVALAAIVLTILLIASKIKGRTDSLGKKPIFASIRPYEWAVLAYWFILLISAIFSDYPKYAFLGSTNRNEGFLMMTAYLFSVVFVGRFYRIKERDFLLLCLIAAVVAGYGICQYYGFDFLHLNPESIAGVEGPNMVYVSTMSNRNLLSTYLCLAFCICLVMFSQQKRTLHWLFLPLGLIIFYMLILGQSESGYVGILLSFCLLFPFLAKSSRITGRLLVMLSVCLLSIWLSVKVHQSNWDASIWAPIAPYLPILSALICILGIVLWLIPTISFQKKAFHIGWYFLLLLMIILVAQSIPRLAQTSNHKTIQAANKILQGNFDDSLGSNRMFVWKRSLSMVPEHLWLGHGPDNFYLSFTIRYGQESVEKNFVRYDKVHNEYIQNLFDNGILGLCALLVFYGIVLCQIQKKRNHPLSLAVFLALTCFMIQAFFNFSSPFAHPIVWTMWGICAGLGTRHNDSDFIILEPGEGFPS